MSYIICEDLLKYRFELTSECKLESVEVDLVDNCNYPRPPTRCWRKKETKAQALGRSVGSFSTMQIKLANVFVKQINFVRLVVNGVKQHVLQLVQGGKVEASGDEVDPGTAIQCK